MKQSEFLYGVVVDIYNSIPTYGEGTKKRDSKKIKKCIREYFEEDYEDIEKDMDENFYLGYEVARFLMLEKFKKRIDFIKENEKNELSSC